MKITDVRVTSFEYGDPVPGHWNGIIGYPQTASKRRFSRVEIHTDSDVVGMTLGGSRALVEGSLKDVILGEDPMRTEHLWQQMYQGNWRKPVAKGEHIRAMSYIDNALWDLKGKVLGEPVWRLLGGARARVPAYAAGGYYQEGKGLRELCAEAERSISAGFQGVKMKIGWSGITLKEDAERVKAVREAIGPDIDLMIDANNAWDAITSIRFGRMVEELDIYWFEEPVHADDLRGSAKVVEGLNMPVATGENEFTRWGFRDLIDIRGVDVVQADPGVCGGISEWIKIAAYAGAHHLNMAPHGNAHLGSVCVAAVTNGLIVEHYGMMSSQRNTYVEPPDFRDGYITLPERPGLGIEWNEAAIQRGANG